MLRVAARQHTIVQSPLARRQSRLRRVLAARDGFGDAAPPRVDNGQARSRGHLLNFWLGEGPSLTLGWLGGASNLTRRGARDGGRDPRLGVNVGIALGARLIPIGDAVPRETLEAGASISLLLQGIVDRRGRVVVCCVRRIVVRVAEPHIMETLIDSAVNALPPRESLGHVPIRGAVGSRVDRLWSVVAARICAARRGGRHHRGHAHVAMDGGHERGGQKIAFRRR